MSPREVEQQRLRIFVLSDSEDNGATTTNDNLYECNEQIVYCFHHNSESEWESEEILVKDTDTEIQSGSLYYLRKGKNHDMVQGNR